MLQNKVNILYYYYRVNIAYYNVITELLIGVLHKAGSSKLRLGGPLCMSGGSRFSYTALVRQIRRLCLA